MATRAPASAEPLSTGRVSLVKAPFDSVPVPGCTSSNAWIIVGASGATVSTTMLNPADVGLMFPAASVAVTVSAWLPLPSWVPGVKVQAPVPSAVVKPINDPLS